MTADDPLRTTEPQLPLGVQLRDDASFEGFMAGPNTEVVACLERMASVSAGGLVYLHGSRGSGKTHLLQAACRSARQAGQSAAYLPLTEFAADESGMLEGMGRLNLLCLDDVQAVCAEQDWALLLMRLCEEARQNQLSLVLAANKAPGQLAAALPDLKSRLAWGLVFALQALDDEERLRALQLHARARGLQLPAEVGQFLLQRSARDLPALMHMLTQLDTASLAAQRRLTIPFVKAVMKL